MSTDLALSGLTKSYGSTRVVDHVTMRIREGEMVAFLGPSGCGKTTTLRMIAGLTDPTAGDVLIGGHDVTKVPVHKRNIGMLFQNYALFPHMTIAENVAFGLKMRRMSRTELADRVTRALELVQLGQMAGRYPRALSGGQQQRIALARAFVIEPSLLLLDEPLGALDKSLREQMQVELRQIQRRLGITAVLVTHDQEEALTMADQIVIMNEGRVEQMGPPGEIYARPVNKFVASFIGSSNFLAGKVEAVAGDESRIALRGGGEIRYPGKVLTAAAAQFIVRPEAVELSPAGSAIEPGQSWTEAVIEDVIYRGQVTHVLLKRDNREPLLAYLPNRTGAETHPGITKSARVVAHWQAASNHLLPQQ